MSINPMVIATSAIALLLFQMETTIQLQIDPMHHVTKELLLQQRRRSRPALEHPQLPDPLVSTCRHIFQLTSTHTGRNSHATFSRLIL